MCQCISLVPHRLAVPGDHDSEKIKLILFYGENPFLLLTVVLLLVLRFLPTIPLPGGGIPPRNGEDMKNTRIELKE